MRSENVNLRYCEIVWREFVACMHAKYPMKNQNQSKSPYIPRPSHEPALQKSPEVSGLPSLQAVPYAAGTGTEQMPLLHVEAVQHCPGETGQSRDVVQDGWSEGASGGGRRRRVGRIEHDMVLENDGAESGVPDTSTPRSKDMQTERSIFLRIQPSDATKHAHFLQTQTS